jgi:hypothetical protein
LMRLVGWKREQHRDRDNACGGAQNCDQPGHSQSVHVGEHFSFQDRTAAG